MVYAVVMRVVVVVPVMTRRGEAGARQEEQREHDCNNSTHGSTLRLKAEKDSPLQV
jgi:hypothetical protein